MVYFWFVSIPKVKFTGQFMYLLRNVPPKPMLLYGHSGYECVSISNESASVSESIDFPAPVSIKKLTAYPLRILGISK
jgi:hypothetical protein